MNMKKNRIDRIKFINKILGLKLVSENECLNWIHYCENLSKNPQPSMKNECRIVQTIANKFNCTNFEYSIEKFVKIIDKFKIKKTNIRYVYSNNDVVIFQGGNPDSVDIIYNNQNYILNIECKNEKGKTTEFTLDHDQNGKLIISEKIKKESPNLKFLIEKFNSETSIFDILGHNYKFKKTDKTINNYYNAIIQDYFTIKRADILIVTKKDFIYAVDVIDDLSLVEFDSTSEIRSCGKNSYNIFTPEHFLKNYDYNKITTSTKRGSSDKTISRYKSNHIYFVRTPEDFNDLSKIKQVKPTISLHITINKDIEYLKNYYK